MEDRKMTEDEINLHLERNKAQDSDTEKVYQEAVDYSNLNALAEMLEKLRQAKPTDRSEKARYYAVVITEFEKVFAYFNTYVIGDV